MIQTDVDWFNNHEYFKWLCVEATGPDYPFYSHLLRVMHDVSFLYFVDHDRNRLYEALELRREFTGEEYVDLYTEEPRVSMLELVLSLAIKCNDMTFEYYGDVTYWFKQLLSNCGLDKFVGVNRNEEVVRDILNRIIHRRYDRNGVVGLFPLNNTEFDQRKVEIWYQMNAYLNEFTSDDTTQT